MSAETARQQGFDNALLWGAAGLAAIRAPVVLLVDVLGLGTAVDLCVARGARVRARLPANGDAGTVGTAPLPSEAALAACGPGVDLDLPALHSAALCEHVPADAVLLLGCLRNAVAVAATAARLAAGRPVTVLAAGARWDDGSLRPTLADELGAGALLALLPGSRSPEAEAAARLFATLHAELPDLIGNSAEGRALPGNGRDRVLELACTRDASAAAPLRVDGWFQDGHGPRVRR